ncbi:hypothetical protein ACWF94_03570 [Streptomyces sp. NPDC055078]
MSADIDRARRTVAAHATSAADCRDLLATLGILPQPPKRRSGRPPVDHGHGHHATYAKGCRCDACRIYCRTWRARRAQDPAAADRAGHGKPSTYKNYGCRCAPCAEAHSAQCAARNARRREAAV